MSCHATISKRGVELDPAFRWEGKSRNIASSILESKPYHILVLSLFKEGAEGPAMANGKEGEVGQALLFSDDELREVHGFRRGSDYIEVTCGCTSRRYGDAVGRLRVFLNGDLEIKCECFPGCNEDKLTPIAFEKHSLRETAPRWKYNIWVSINGKKIPLEKTVLLRYYHYRKAMNGSQTSHMKVFHRDEFVRCCRCNKERRFRLRTKEECRLYHDALVNINWNCADLPCNNQYHIQGTLPSGMGNGRTPTHFNMPYSIH
ncbi:hypothetical protein SAY86_027746 [Trapa natans]|uniref:Protein ULTRAPETALA 1 n=1 Tax=Trapa natans TaxID=22666 RepID=A0AAN7KUJ2_TRANT|nr:hypothetical protein SAY86_027746 [Trapa natans]